MDVHDAPVGGINVTIVRCHKTPVEKTSEVESVQETIQNCCMVRPMCNVRRSLLYSKIPHLTCLHV